MSDLHLSEDLRYMIFRLAEADHISEEKELEKIIVKEYTQRQLDWRTYDGSTETR